METTGTDTANPTCDWVWHYGWEVMDILPRIQISGSVTSTPDFFYNAIQHFVLRWNKCLNVDSDNVKG
jgi:hypothetical protein